MLPNTSTQAKLVPVLVLALEAEEIRHVRAGGSPPVTRNLAKSWLKRSLMRNA